MYNVKDIVFEESGFFILDIPDSKTYDIYKIGCTCSKRVGKVSKSLGVGQAIKNINILHRKKAIKKLTLDDIEELLKAEVKGIKDTLSDIKQAL